MVFHIQNHAEKNTTQNSAIPITYDKKKIICN